MKQPYSLFSNGLLRSTDFSAGGAVLDAALERVRARGNTALNDHLYLALKRLDTRQGRRVVLLLSDGADVHSVLGMRDVLWKAQRSQAMIYWIRLEDDGPHGGASFNSSWRNYVENEAEFELLERSVEDSGGRIVSVTRVSDVPSAFRRDHGRAARAVCPGLLPVQYQQRRQLAHRPRRCARLEQRPHP